MKNRIIQFFLFGMLLSIMVVSATAQTNDALAEQAINLIRAQKLEEGLGVCQKLLQSDPRHPQGNYACGAASFWLNKNADAEKYLREAEKTIKNNARLYSFLGKAILTNRPDAVIEAKKFFNTAIEIDPKLYFPYFFRAQLWISFYNLFGMGDRPKEEYQALEKSGLASSVESEKLEVIMDLEKVQELAPSDLNSLYLLAQIYLRTKEYDKAITRLKTRLANPPNDPTVAGNLCNLMLRAYWDSQRRAEAIPQLKTCAATMAKLNDTASAARLYQFVNIARLLKDKAAKVNFLTDDDYLNDLNEWLALQKNMDVYLLRADVYIAHKDFVKAEADMTESEKMIRQYQLTAKLFDLNLRKAKILLARDKKFAEALKLTDEALANDATNQQALLLSAELRGIYLKQDLPLASKHLKAAFASDKSLREIEPYKSLQAALASVTPPNTEADELIAKLKMMDKNLREFLEKAKRTTGKISEQDLQTAIERMKELVAQANKGLALDLSDSQRAYLTKYIADGNNAIQHAKDLLAN